MRSVVRLLLAVLAVIFSSGPTRAEVDFGHYHALVIGNDAYRHLPRLKTAVADAKAFAELLRSRYGFEAELLRDATKRDILERINRYRTELTEDDNLLIYYAGHGWLDRQTNTGYWQPVDAESDDDFNWIANGELTRRLRGMAARHILVIADSCYSGTLLRGAAASAPAAGGRAAWLARMAAKRSRTAIVSGGIEPVADSGQGSHSVFAGALLRALRENGEILEASELFRRIGRPVVLNSDQTPQLSDIRNAGHEGGTFIFVPKGATVLVVPQTQAAAGDKAAADIVFWRSIENSTDAAPYKAYLETFPNGQFAALARLKIEELNALPASASDAGSGAPSAPPTLATLDFPGFFRLREDLVLRNLPRSSAYQVGAFKKGERLFVIGPVDNGEWYRVANGAIVAYAHAPALREESPAEAAEARSRSQR